MKYYLLITIAFACLSGLRAQMKATIPYAEDFQNWDGYSTIDEHDEWTTETQLGRGMKQVVIETNGNRYLFMWAGFLSCNECNFYQTNANAALKVTLTTDKNYNLTFNWRKIASMTGFPLPAPNTPDINDSSLDGIYLSSDNGETYAKVYTFQNTQAEWNSTTLDITSLAKFYGIQLNDNFRIKFQCYTIDGTAENGAVYDRHLQIDNISITEQAIQGNYHVVYAYDAAGNRVGKAYTQITLKSSSSKQDSQIPLKENLGDKKVIIYPNPTKGNLKINVESDIETLFNYTLYSNEGKVLLTGEIISGIEHSLEMESYKTGAYILILKNKEEKLTYKIIKE